MARQAQQDGSSPASCPTLPDDPGLKKQRRARWLRRLYMSLLAAFVIAGLFGFWGVRQRSGFASEEGWTLDVHYAAVTRAGLAVPMKWEITKAGGFGPEEAEPKVVIRITQDYFELFDENGVDPEPSTSWSDGEFVYWEFDAPPDQDKMHITFDTRTGSGVQLLRKKAETSLVVDDRYLAVVRLKTWVMP